ncbi:hypothetical protein D3C80_1296090 [compost metagenome]
MARIDIHRPSAIIPSDYVFVCAFSYSEAALMPGVLDAERATLERHMAHTGGEFSKHEHGGSCHVCGAWMKDYAIFFHVPTNTYIKTGFDCAQKMEFDDPDLFRRIRDRRLAAEKSVAGKLKAEGLIDEMGLSLEVAYSIFRKDGWGVYANDELLDKFAELVWFENTLYAACDIIRALVKYGNLSEKQWDYLGKCLVRIAGAQEQLDNRAAIEAAKHANSKPAPEGKVVVVGKVISHKYSENIYNGVDHKMLVEHADGWRVWVTVPAAISELDKGWEVQFTATLTPSPDDKFFCFGSRPSKASIISQGE